MRVPSLSIDRHFAFLIGINVLVVAAATILSGGQFLTLDNLQSMGGQLPEMALLALGIMLSMISGNGGIDLSGVALSNLSGMIAALLLPLLVSADDHPILYTIVFSAVVIGAGIVGGILNGVVIARLRLTPILCTLGTSLLFTGIAVVLSNGTAVNVEYVDQLSDIGNGTILQIPISLIILVATVGLIAWVLARTPFGLRLYLMGTNPKAAFYTGIPRVRMLVITYGICGTLASLAGLISASHTSAAKWDYGNSYLLIAILIAVMGGVNPAGGYGRIICVFLASTALQFLSSFFNLLGVSQFFGNCVWGFLLLVSLAFTGGESLPFRIGPGKSTPKPDAAPASTAT